MGTLSLTASFQDSSNLGPTRTFNLVGSSDCAIAFEAGSSSGMSGSGPRIVDPSSVGGGKAGQPSTPLVLKGPFARSLPMTDSSNALRYVVLSGTVTACWVDAVFPGASAPGAATSGAIGQAQMSVAPAVAATPIAVGTNDPRVTTIEVPIALSGSDGSLAEIPIPRPAPGAACTLVSATIDMAAAVAANDTNYLTLTLAKRDGAGGSATTLVAGTTQATGGVNTGGGLLAFREVSLGAPSVTAIASGDVLTFKSVKTAAGVASGAGKLKLVFSVP